MKTNHAIAAAQNEIIAQMIKGGASTPEISNALGGALNSRQISARVHSLGLLGEDVNRRKRDVLLANRITASVSVNPNPPKTNSRFYPLDGVRPVPIIKHKENQCRWPVTVPDQFGSFYCGADKASAGSYCSAHREMAWSPRGAGGKSHYTLRCEAVSNA